MKIKFAIVLATVLFASTVLSGTPLFAEVRYEKIKTQKGFKGHAQSLAFSPSGKLVAMGTSDKSVVIWDTATWQIVKTISENEGDVNAVAFSHDGKLLAAGDRKKKVYLFDTQNWKKIGKIKAASSISKCNA